MQRSRIFHGLLCVCIGGLLALAAADVVLGILPVRTPFQTMPTNDQNPVLHFRPDRDFTFSLGWDFRALNHGHINNAGFINNQDYNANATTPLLAVIGNSYIEAGMIPYTQTLQGHLQHALGGEARVYSFGVSAAHLAQYLTFAEFSRKAYHPAAMIFVVTWGDVLQSLLRNEADPSGHYAYVDRDGTLKLDRVDLQPAGPIRRIVSSTALGDYLFFNLNAQLLISDAKAVLFGNHSSAALSPEEKLPRDRIVVESRAVSDAFFRDLPSYSGLPPDRILFVIDGPHSPEDSADTYLESEVFQAIAHSRGYRTIDMGKLFKEQYRPGEPVDISSEVPSDHHWNERGHGLAADAILRSGFLSQVLAPSQTAPP